MQVVYSGGSTTPQPSPRIQRKIGYSRPVMPGYNTHVQPQVFGHRAGEKLTEGDTTLRDSIPLMSKGVAILCLVLNILIPGSGTLTAGLSVLCCSKVRPRGGTKRHCIWMNAGVALIQFLLTFLFLLGWIWSITWGVAFLTISRQHSKRQAAEGRHRHKEGEKTHTRIYDTSKTPQTDSQHYSDDEKPNNRHEQHQHHHTDQQKHHNQHHQHHHHHQQQHQRQQHHPQPHHQQQHHHHHHPHHHSDNNHHHRTDQLGHHHNNNRSRQDIRKSRTPSPRESPGIPRNENSWVTLNNNTFTPAQTQTQTQSKNSNSLDPAENNAGDNKTTVPHQPIIVLQKAPELNTIETADDVRSSPNDTIMQARTRHMKILQRKMSDNDLSPFVLTNKQLEAIVIHDLPLVSSNVPRNGHIHEEESEGLPKMEIA